MVAMSDPGMALRRGLATVPRIPLPFSLAIPSAAAAAWCRMRHHGSWLSVHRVGRHVAGCRDCVLCADAQEGSWLHCLRLCPSGELCALRAAWWAKVRNSFPWACLDAAPAAPLEDWFFGILDRGVLAANALWCLQAETVFRRRLGIARR